MKTLVILSHPDITHSTLNKQVVTELKKHPELFTVHNLYEEYPNEKIDVLAEQQLIESHNGLILQFPIYWYNCPPLLKKWLDDVLAYNWAYGPSGEALKDKHVGLIVTTGADESAYQAKGGTMTDVLTPFRMTFEHTNSNFAGFYPIYGPSITPEIVQAAVDFAKKI